MIRRALLLAFSAALALAALAPATAAAAPEPAWKLSLISMPTNFTPGSSEGDEYMLIATNVGGAPTSGQITFTDTLPGGLTPVAVEGASNDDPQPVAADCGIALQVVTCAYDEPLTPGRSITIQIRVEVADLAEGSTLDNTITVQGGGADLAHDTTTTTTISSFPCTFEFLPGEAGLSAPLNEEDGSPTLLAGSHPFQLTIGAGFPTEKPGDPLQSLTGTEHLQEVSIDLPPGLIGNPAALLTRCTEAQLVSQQGPDEGGCPQSSQVGTTTVLAAIGGLPANEIAAVYNMVPPPGAPAAFAFDAVGAGIFVHVLPSLRSDSDYGISATTSDILALDYKAVLGVQGELWGDPGSASHDGMRGTCALRGGVCPAGEANTESFFALPVDCPGEPDLTGGRARSWEQPEEEHEALYESADLAGNPVAIEDCAALEYEPQIKVQPTTNLSDSPTGLDFTLTQPQEFDLAGRSTGALRDISVALPPGLTVNASSAAGLGACSNAQIGYEPFEGEIFFSNAPARCPDASKLGTVEVKTPLLAQYDAENKVQRDGEGKPIPEPLHGSIFLAEPFANPFGSLIAIYVTVEDPQTGIFAKLASEVSADPVSGQLTASLHEAPELPLEEAKLHFFDGPRSGLQTPATCGTHTAEALLSPWSAPEAPDVELKSSFATTAAPGGGPCPGAEAQLPNNPAFTAGTLAPQAGAYSPFVLKLSREDGSQRLARLEATLPRGMAAKLAGVPYCSEAQIAAAGARSGPNEGALEQAAPSCPAASEVGIVTAGAGAGPTPFYTQGHLYLAGPYKGAPLSIVAITPAVAGPFDLGAVVIRSAVYLDPATAQARVITDPLPRILAGVPLNLRSAAVSVSRAQFTLNPTSCNEKATTAAATSVLGQVAALSERFQLGGCEALPFKPRLEARLFGPTNRGGHPRFRAVLSARPGEAGIARAVVTLPRSEFIDQGHFRTICTRVQYAAKQCPAGSIYGHVQAFTPLFDYPLEGPIYLRSSSQELPDIVFALRGPPSQPIAVDVVGHVDSLNGRLRTTFDEIPDAPITKAIVVMQGAKKGLFQNSTNLCKGTHRLSLKAEGHNGKAHDRSPALKAACKKGKGKGKGGKGSR